MSRKTKKLVDKAVQELQQEQVEEQGIGDIPKPGEIVLINESKWKVVRCSSDAIRITLEKL